MKISLLISALLLIATSAFAATQESLVDKRDGKAYKTVKIGNQTWMAENLNYNVDSSFCYNNEESNCAKYGRLYKWNAAMKACPDGWHLPSKEEFEILFKFVGGAQEDAWKWENAGKMLKSTNGWNEYEGKDGNGNDAFGFSALPAGYRNGNGDFNNEGNRAYFWSSTESVSGSAYYMGLDFSKDDAFLNSFYKTHGFSVRCVKD